MKDRQTLSGGIGLVFLTILLVVFIGGCKKKNSDDDLLTRFFIWQYLQDKPTLTVLSQNLYLGSAFDSMVADFNNPVATRNNVAQFWSNVQDSNIPARAKAHAAQIAWLKPHLVSLQEVSLYRIETPATAAPATVVAYDYLQLILDELQNLDQEYSVVAAVTGADVEVYSSGGEDIRITDRDVILARSDVITSNSQGERFNTRVTPDLVLIGADSQDQDITVQLYRSWVGTDVSFSGSTYRLINTHLEVEGITEPFQLAQAAELLSMLNSEQRPIILMGDFNSDADNSTSTTYANIRATGYSDVWNIAHPFPDPGLTGPTCCQDSDLLNADSVLSRRIDHIFIGNATVEVLSAEVVGDDVSDKTPGGLWPSDHGGMTATMRLLPR